MSTMGGRGAGPPGTSMGSFGGGPGRGASKQAATKQLKEMMQSGHKTGLPGTLLKLFESRKQLPLAAHIQHQAAKVPMTGLAGYVNEFAAPEDPEYEPPTADRPPSPRLMRNPELCTQARIEKETRTEKKLRLSKWKLEEAERETKEAVSGYDPVHDSKLEGDPYKTLIVARLSFDVTEKKLKREFEEFGPIKRVKVVMDKNGKHRGYAFVEYENKKDMKEAYKLCDGKKVEGRRIIVDVERGRTVEGWRPRRLGGGLGGEGRLPKAPKKGPKGAAAAVLASLMMNAGGGGGGDRNDRITAEPDRPRERPSARDEPVRRERARTPPPSSRTERAPPPAPSRGEDRGPSSRDTGGDRDRERKREREPSPKRGGDRDAGVEKRRHVEEGEVRGGRERERERERPRRERDIV